MVLLQLFYTSEYCLRDERKKEKTKVQFRYSLSLALTVRVFEPWHPRGFLLDSLFDFSLFASKSPHLLYRYLKILYPTTRVITQLSPRLTYLRVSLNGRKREEEKKKHSYAAYTNTQKIKNLFFFFIFFNFFYAHGQHK